MRITLVSVAALLLASVAAVRADEGMWLFSAPPREKLEASYGFKADDAWLNHVMRASVRFDSGGSGSFVSGDGLVITNHHVGLDALQKMSDSRKNFVRDGFYAATSADEAKCLDLELNVLESTEDVTARVNAAVPAGAAGDESAKARRKVFAEIEKESHDKTGLRSDVITLYQGGAYHLYRYKRYTDIRLVFAPEQQAAFFGGDPDNFEYPRYDLDICIFRVYENGQAVHPDHFLKWSVGGSTTGTWSSCRGTPAAPSASSRSRSWSTFATPRFPSRSSPSSGATSSSPRGARAATRTSGARSVPSSRYAIRASSSTDSCLACRTPS
jgi:hypothetical protein